MKSILIIDDDAGTRFYLSVMIKKLDPTFTVLEAHDGEEAEEILADDHNPPALIILDINMPIMDGFEFLQRNRERIRAAETRVIIQSSSEDPGDKAAINATGLVKDYLLKPIDREKLIKCLSDSHT